MSSSSLADIWSTFVERPLDRVGLFRNPVKRFAVVAVGTALILRATKPHSLFDKEGNARPSALFSSSDAAIPLDYITLSVIIGGLGVLLV